MIRNVRGSTAGFGGSEHRGEGLVVSVVEDVGVRQLEVTVLDEGLAAEAASLTQLPPTCQPTRHAAAPNAA